MGVDLAPNGARAGFLLFACDPHGHDVGGIDLHQRHALGREETGAVVGPFHRHSQRAHVGENSRRAEPPEAWRVARRRRRRSCRGRCCGEICHCGGWVVASKEHERNVVGAKFLFRFLQAFDHKLVLPQSCTRKVRHEVETNHQRQTISSFAAELPRASTSVEQAQLSRRWSRDIQYTTQLAPSTFGAAIVRCGVPSSVRIRARSGCTNSGSPAGKKERTDLPRCSSSRLRPSRRPIPVCFPPPMSGSEMAAEDEEEEDANSGRTLLVRLLRLASSPVRGALGSHRLPVKGPSSTIRALMTQGEGRAAKWRPRPYLTANRHKSACCKPWRRRRAKESSDAEPV